MSFMRRKGILIILLVLFLAVPLYVIFSPQWPSVSPGEKSASEGSTTSDPPGTEKPAKIARLKKYPKIPEARLADFSGAEQPHFIFVSTITKKNPLPSTRTSPKIAVPKKPLPVASGIPSSDTSSDSESGENQSAAMPEVHSEAEAVSPPCIVRYTITSRWDSGYVTSLELVNNTETPINGWKAGWIMPGNQKILSLWNANKEEYEGNILVSNLDWNEYIPPFSDITLGFEVSGDSPSSQLPFNFSLNDLSCDFIASPLPEATSLPNSNNTTPGNININTNQNISVASASPQPPIAKTSWPLNAFAPYIDATAYPAFALTQTAQDSGVKLYTLGFIVAKSNGDCTPSWGTYYDIGEYLKSDIASLRQLGGDVMPSFGGAANTELAVTCKDTDSLTRSYQAVIDGYGLKRIDFDIEGAWLAEKASIERRSESIAILQKNNPALPVLPSGLTPDGLNVLESALDKGVRIDGVNIMAMDYGDSAAPNPAGKMGDYAIEASNSLFQQLKNLYSSQGLNKTDNEIWKMIGVTPMLGVNDIASEIFTLSDAQKLLNFAKQKGLGMLSMWSGNRDKACSGGVKTYADSSCSSIEQEPFAFMKAFGRLNQE